MRLAIIRSSSIVLNTQEYNVQEIGLAKSLFTHGVSVDIFMAGNVRKHEIKILKKNDKGMIRLYLLPYTSLPGKQALFSGLLKILTENNYAVIQVHEDTQITSVFVSIWAKKKGIPVVLCQGMYKNYSGASRFIQFWYDLVFLPFLRGNIKSAIAKTEAAKSYLKKKGFSDIYVCPIGLDAENFQNSSLMANKKLSEIFKENKLKNIVYIGSLEKRRNPFFLLDIFKELSLVRNDVRLIIAGEGPDKEELIQRINNGSYDGRVHYLGKLKQEEITVVLKHADAFLLPSNYEIYGMVILESMYFGVPVFSTPTAGAVDIIKDEINGFLIEDLNISLWKSKIEYLFNNIDKATEIRKNAKSTVRDQFLWDNACLTFLNVYKQVKGI